MKHLLLFGKCVCRFQTLWAQKGTRTAPFFSKNDTQIVTINEKTQKKYID